MAKLTLWWSPVACFTSAATGRGTKQAIQGSPARTLQWVDDGWQPEDTRWPAAMAAAFNSLQLGIVGVEVAPQGNRFQII